MEDNKKSKNKSYNTVKSKEVKVEKVNIKQVNIHEYPVLNPFENHPTKYNILIIESK